LASWRALKVASLIDCGFEYLLKWKKSYDIIFTEGNKAISSGALVLKR
jgi:hypothetical protein